MQSRQKRMMLPVQANDAERDQAAREFVSVYNRHQELLSEKDQVYAAWRKRVKDSAGRVSHASELVERGLREAMVDVREDYNLEEELATIVRLDTGEVHATRPMTEDEIQLARQQEIALEDDDEDEE